MLSALLVLLFTFFSKPAIAQISTPISNSFTQYQNDYFYQRTLYQKAFTVYTEKSQIDGKYSSITTQNDKLSALKDTLIKRNNMYKVYFIALQTLLDSNKSINFTNTEKIQNDISDLEKWLDDQNQVINNFSNINDIKTWASGFKTKYAKIQRTTYTALVQNEINLDMQTLSDITNLTNQIQSQPEISEQNKSLINDINSNSTEVNTYLTNALNLTQKEDLVQDHYSDFYPTAKLELNKAKDNLSNMLSNLKIIVTKMND